jgi:outer membrane usher protein
VRHGYAYYSLALVLALVTRAAHAAEVPQTLLLDVVINGRDTGDIVAFTREGHDLSAARADLEAAGFRLPADAASDPQAPIPLHSLAGITFHENSLSQTLEVTGNAQGLVAARLGPGANDAAPQVGQTGTGAALNYSLASTYDTVTKDSYLAGSFDGWVFTPFGVLESGLLTYANAGQSLGTTSPAVRLDTTYTYSQASVLRQYIMGDVISSSLAWTRSVRLGGAQISTDFALQPDLITSPLPSISGQAAVPSTVDVLVNGVQQFTSKVDAGPFTIPQIPVVTGQGTVSVVVTDALGRQSIETMPFYNAAQLLSPGRSSFSVEGGSVRLNYGQASDDYHGLAGFASIRHGVFPWLTLEAHAEGTASLGMGGVGIDVAVGNLGILTASAAASGSYGQSGRQYQAGFQHVGRHLSVSLSRQVASAEFRDVAAIYGQPVPTTTTQASLGLPLGLFGSFGVTYSDIIRPAATVPGNPFAPASTQSSDDSTLFSFLRTAQHVRLLTGTYSITLFRSIYASLTGFEDLATGGGVGVFASLSIPLGGRTSADIGVTDNGGETSAFVQAARSAVSAGDVGWQVLASQGASSQQSGQLTYKSSWGLMDAGAARLGDDSSARADLQGAIAVGDGGIFAANTIQDSFAMVDTDGAPGVQVLQDNQPVGRTDGGGRLLVPNLRSYQSNPIAINPLDVPVDADVGVTARIIRPANHTGVVVRFPIHRSEGALVTLVGTDGKPLPLGSRIILKSTGAKAVMGYDGQAFLENLAPRNIIDVTDPAGKTCHAAFPFHALGGDLPDIGPLTCHPGAAP